MLLLQVGSLEVSTMPTSFDLLDLLDVSDLLDSLLIGMYVAS